MTALEGRVAIVTGAGRGIGREHALLFASEGARVVVNDLGVAADGTGADRSPADEVVAEIVAAGGDAVANHDDVTSWDGARDLVATAVEAFGDLHVLVNNAGIIRDRMLVNLAEEEWDAVVTVHLKGHAAPLRHAAAWWRSESKAGRRAARAVINTSSTSGLFGNPGQTSYGAAKAGIASLTMIAAEELAPYGVRVNAIAPVALTRLTAGLAGGPGSPADERSADPGAISPFVAYLATEGCTATGRVFFVRGGDIGLFQPWALVAGISRPGRWTVEELTSSAADLATHPFALGNPFLAEPDGGFAFPDHPTGPPADTPHRGAP